MLFGVAGNTQTNDIITGVIVLLAQGYWPIASLVFFCAILAPAVYFGGVAFVAASCESGRHMALARRVLGLVEHVESWSLVPVFAAACFVAVVKLDLIGSVTWETGIFWVLCLSLCSLALGSTFDSAAAARILHADTATR
jgi:paraquat-inducible protein A